MNHSTQVQPVWALECEPCHRQRIPLFLYTLVTPTNEPVRFRLIRPIHQPRNKTGYPCFLRSRVQDVRRAFSVRPHNIFSSLRS